VMDDYYRHQGWDVASGWPTAERLAELDMPELHETMVQGARRAKEALPPPPEARPVPLIHG